MSFARLMRTHQAGRLSYLHWLLFGAIEQSPRSEAALDTRKTYQSWSLIGQRAQPSPPPPPLFSMGTFLSSAPFLCPCPVSGDAASQPKETEGAVSRGRSQDLSGGYFYALGFEVFVD